MPPQVVFSGTEARDCRCRSLILIGGCVTGTRPQQVTSINRGGQYVNEARFLVEKVISTGADECLHRYAR